jgi:hypothetical protein
MRCGLTHVEGAPVSSRGFLYMGDPAAPRLVGKHNFHYLVSYHNECTVLAIGRLQGTAAELKAFMKVGAFLHKQE